MLGWILFGALYLSIGYLLGFKIERPVNWKQRFQALSIVFFWVFGFIWMSLYTAYYKYNLDPRLRICRKWPFRHDWEELGFRDKRCRRCGCGHYIWDYLSPKKMTARLTKKIAEDAEFKRLQNEAMDRCIPKHNGEIK